MSIREPHFLDVTGCVDEVPYSGPHRLVCLLLKAELCELGQACGAYELNNTLVLAPVGK
ncbi:MAG TPA: hypothetical protein PK027_12790 [Aquimonas sp.]|nr:hypothetical protein [Aquimonas sp.]